MKQALIICLSLASLQSAAQTSWTMQQCMQYAVAHNHEVKRAELTLDNYQAAQTGAIDGCKFRCSRDYVENTITVTKLPNDDEREA